ncbi:MAG: YihY/virulence factor BrkB family protein [Catalinimonas sp.]
MKDTTAWALLKGTVQRFGEADPIIYAAAIAFFTIFSLPSILVIVISVASLFLDRKAIEGQVYTQFEGLIGTESAVQVQSVIENAGAGGSSTIATVVGVATLLFSATVIFNFVQKALNALWGVKAKPRRGVVKFGLDRLTSFAIIVGLAFMMLVSLLVDALLNFFRDIIAAHATGVAPVVMQIANLMVSTGVAFIIFAATFKMLPDVKIRWKDVWVGAGVTAVLFEVGKVIIGLLLSNIGITATYGAAGAFVGILLWVFYSSIVVLIGAAFTQAYVTQRGHNIRPTHNSVKIVSTEIEIEDHEDHKEVEQRLEKAAEAKTTDEKDR